MPYPAGARAVFALFLLLLCTHRDVHWPPPPQCPEVVFSESFALSPALQDCQKSETLRSRSSALSKCVQGFLGWREGVGAELEGFAQLLWGAHQHQAHLAGGRGTGHIQQEEMWWMWSRQSGSGPLPDIADLPPWQEHLSALLHNGSSREVIQVKPEKLKDIFQTTAH